MKAILFIAMMSWGPNYPDKPAVAHVLRYVQPSMEACEDVINLPLVDEPDYAGKIGNLPGYRIVHRVWCEPSNEPWP